MSSMSVEMQILFCAVALGIVQLVLSVLFSVGGRGLLWGIGPRDEVRPTLAKIGGRIERAWDNFRETFPIFAVAVLMGQALGLHTPLSLLGAQIYIWARLIYVPAYVIAIPFTRTLIWTASFVGILLVLSPIWPG